ncbi:MAG: DUF2971 domain-containing protein [Planctomycetaceae bacterium]|nr:DUF2971 domain-containing protein [Planctomycetaceae bacterium]MCB9953124.1 DUF2971 domain-containing protein [Planctomycetaceae bacterium]
MQIPDRLYRYRSAGSSLGYLLSEVRGLLWCSNAEFLNDPFDGLATVPVEDVRRQIPMPGGYDYRVVAKQRWAAACFSEIWDNPAMWAHYATYSGVCLCYDAQKLTELVAHRVNTTGSSSDIGSLVRVTYVNPMPTSFSDVGDALRTKTNVWEYEKEWRLLYRYHSPLDSPSRGKSLNLGTPMPNPCLREVILGLTADEHTQMAIQDVLREKTTDVIISKLRLDNSAGVLRRVPLAD